MAATIKVRNSIKILPCPCDIGPGAEYQDKVYGKQKRVHNSSKDGFRCSICSNLKRTSAE